LIIAGECDTICEVLLDIIPMLEEASGLLVFCVHNYYYAHGTVVQWQYYKNNGLMAFCLELPGEAGTRRNIHPLTAIL